MKHTFIYRDKSFTLDLVQSAKSYQATFGESTVTVEVSRQESQQLDLLIDHRVIHAYVSRDGAKSWVTVNGQTLLLNSQPAHKNSEHESIFSNQIIAQMPGLVRAVSVVEGELVKKGQPLAILEAMKMENKLTAPMDGLVKKLMIKVGQTVERDQVLIEFSPPNETELNPQPSLPSTKKLE